MAFEPYHWSWLSAHPHRTTDWLKEKLAEGFDVHHLDGDHQNDAPDNLVLIEHTDHMMIHGGRTMGRLRPRRADSANGKLCYEERASTFSTWSSIAREVLGPSKYPNEDGAKAIAAAKQYALAAKCPWPISAPIERQTPAMRARATHLPASGRKTRAAIDALESQ